MSELAECCFLRVSLGVTIPVMKFLTFLAEDDEMSMEDFLNDSNLSRELCLLRLYVDLPVKEDTDKSELTELLFDCEPKKL